MSNDWKMFLKTFLNIELYFFCDRSRQEKAWANAYNDQPYGISFLLFFEAWSVVLEDPNQCGLSKHHVDRIQKLKCMLETFYYGRPLPTRPHEYREIMNHNDWRAIQRYARELHDTIKVVPDPEICPECQEVH